MTKAEIQQIRSLAHKQHRLEQGLFVAEGEKLVEELLASTTLRVRKVFVTSTSTAVSRFAQAEVISPKEMERISQLKTPSDFLALVETPHYRLELEQLCNSLTLCLDGVQDPGNLGTILRLADWFGIGDVICSAHSADCFNPKVVQATMGAIARIRVHYVPLPPLITALLEREVPIYGTFLEGERIYDAQISQKGLIVMGSEGRGVSAQVEELISHRLYIPPYPREEPASESLNVAVATAVICAEFRRRA